MPLPPIGSTPSYSVTTGAVSPYSGTSQEAFDPGDTLDLARTGGTVYASSQSFALQPAGSTGNFLYVGPGTQNTTTIAFAQAVHYYGFLWGTPDPNPANPANGQGVRLYSGNELVATYTADTLGLNWDTRYVNFTAAQDKPLTRAELFAHTNFETDNHAVYTAAPAPPPAPGGTPTVVDFESFTPGDQNTNVLTSQGFRFTGALAYYNLPANDLIIQKEGYATNVLHTHDWFADVTVTKSDGTAFELVSFDYGPDMFSYPGDGTPSDAVVTGYYAGGGTVSTTFSDIDAQSPAGGQKTMATLGLNWTNLSAVKIDWSGGASGAYGSLDNFRFTSGGSPPNYGPDIVENGSFEANDIATGSWQMRNVTGWQGVTGQTLELHDSLHAPLSSGTGPQYVELSNGGLRQALSTSAGKTYQLDFAYRYGNDGTAQSNAIEVWFGSQKVGEVNPVQGQPWQSVSYTIAGTGASTELQLRMKAGQENGEGAFVDAVRVRAVIAEAPPPTVTLPGTLTVTEDVASPIVFLGTPFSNPGASVPPPTLGTNVLVNGSFEAQDIATGTWAWSSITGWTGITGPAVELHDSYSAPFSSGTGPQYLELANGGIQQTVSTTAGKNYQLDFAYRYGNDGTAQSNAFEVWFAGQKIADVDPVQGQAWQNATYTLSGTGGASNLQIRMKNGQENGEGAFVDGFQLREITPPTSGGDPLTVTLSVADGTLGGNAGTGITVGGTATSRTFTGTVGDLNAYFTTSGKITYTTAPDASGVRTLTTSVSNGTRSASAATLINISPVNDAPVLSAPATQTMNENATLVFSSANGNRVSLSDVDAGNAPIQLQLSVTNGTLSLSDGTGTSTPLSQQTPSTAWNGYYLRNDLGETNLPLKKGGVTYSSGILTHPGSTPNQISTVSYAINGATSFTATLGIDESTWAPAQNFGNGVAYYVYLDNVLAYSSGPVTAGAAPIALNVDTTGKSTLTLGVSPLSSYEYDHTAWFDARLNGGPGLTLVSGANGSSSMTWRGSAAAIDAALASLAYTPTRDYNGSATLTLAASDLGNTGAGGALTASRSVAITINAVDSAPTINAPGSFRVIEDRTSPLLFTGTPFADADSTLLMVTLAIADGTLHASSGNGITLGGGPTARTFTGTAANLNAYFTQPGSLAYTTAPNNTATRTLTITASDGALSTQATSLVLIEPEPITPRPRPKPPAPSPAPQLDSAWGAATAKSVGALTFERSVGPMSTDKSRPTETFEPDVVRSLEVSGGLAIGPTAAAAPIASPPLDPANHSMLVGRVSGAPQAEKMTVDVSGRSTTSLGFDWGRAGAGQAVELYSGTRLMGRYGASEVFADAPERTTPSGYVTFRSLDGTPITRAVFSAPGGSPLEVDNVSTDPTGFDKAPVAPAASSRTIYVRLGLYGQSAGTGTGAGSSPAPGSGQAAIAAASAAAAGMGPGTPGATPPGRWAPIVVTPPPQRRVLDFYGIAPSSSEEVVLRAEEIEMRSRLMSVFAMLAPGNQVDKKALERAYAMRI
ncbi:MAG: NPCBM/NEW2 domain-containing protein [Rubrivivax sp.]